MHSDNMNTRALVLSLMVAGLILTVIARLYLFPMDRNQRATATLQSVTDIAEAIQTFKSDFGQFPRDLDQLKSASRPYVLGAATLSDAWGNRWYIASRPERALFFTLRAAMESMKTDRATTFLLFGTRPSRLESRLGYLEDSSVGLGPPPSPAS